MKVSVLIAKSDEVRHNDELFVAVFEGNPIPSEITQAIEGFTATQPYNAFLYPYEFETPLEYVEYCCKKNLTFGSPEGLQFKLIEVEL